MKHNHDNTADDFLLHESGHNLRDTNEDYQSDYDPTNASRGSMTWRTLPPLAAPTDQGHLGPPSAFHVFPMQPDAQRAGPIGTAPIVPFAQGALAAHAVQQSSPSSSTDRAQSVGGSPVPSGHQQPLRTFHCPLKQQTGCEEVFSRQFDAERHARTTRAHSALVEAEATRAAAGPRIVCDQCEKSFARKDNLTKHRKKYHS